MLRALGFCSLMLMLGKLQQVCGTESRKALVTYPEPVEVTYTHHNDDYTVKVRTPDGRWQDLYEYNVKVDLDKPQDASMVYFDFSGAVEVSVRKNNGDVHSVRIRPAVYGIRPKVKGNTVYFRLTQPRKLSIEFDGDRLHNLHLLANSLESTRPEPGNPDVIYFGPGVHQLPVPKVEASERGAPVQPTGVLQIPSGKTVYIAGGAILRGKLLLDHVHDVKIMGRGILEQSDNAIEVDHSSRVSIEGLIVINPTHYTLQCGESDHLEVRNLKTFSAAPWSDGIDMMSCSDVQVSDVFLRTSDDCIAIYAHRWGFYGDSRNIRVSDSVLWADIAHPMTIGIHGDSASNPDTIEDVEYHNIDVLEHDERNPEYQGSMAINAGDSNLVRNVTYSDIRIDDFQEGQLVNLRVVFNHKYNTSPGRGVENITFRNILYRGDGASPSVIAGLDPQRRVRNVRFENLVVNGRRVLEPRDGNIEIGDFADNVRFVR